MTERKFKSKYLCVVNPLKLKVYDFKKKKQIRKKRFNTNGRDGFPIIGYMCEICNTYNNIDKLYLVKGKAAHFKCGMVLLNSLLGGGHGFKDKKI